MKQPVEAMMLHWDAGRGKQFRVLVAGRARRIQLGCHDNGGWKIGERLCRVGITRTSSRRSGAYWSQYHFMAVVVL